MRVTSLQKEVEFDAGHRVPNHGSKCYNPHGHRYRVRVTCSGSVVGEPGAADEGMVVDFGDLKKWMTELVHDKFDHAFVVFSGDRLMREALSQDETWAVVVVDWIPTAENFAHDIFDILHPVVATHWRENMALTRVEVWETPTSCAIVEA